MEMATPSEAGPGTSSSPLTLLCWNINGLGPTLPNIKLKHKSLKGFFAHMGSPDVVCFQEMKLSDSKVTEEMACVDGYESFWAISRERQSYSGVTTWLRSPPWHAMSAAVDDVGSSTGADLDLDREGRVVITDLGSFVVANVYAPNAGDRPARPRLDFKCRFLSVLKTRLCQYLHQGKEVVLVGDLNVAAERRDVHSTFNYDQIFEQHELQVFHSLLSEFKDVWRLLHPDAEDCYTVWEERTSARAFNAGSRIDYVLVSPGLLPHVESCEILHNLPPKWSDHAPLLLKLRNMQPPKPCVPLPQSSRRMKRFMHGPTIASLFAQATPAKRVKSTTPPAADVAEAQQQATNLQQQQQQQQQMSKVQQLGADGNFTQEGPSVCDQATAVACTETSAATLEGAVQESAGHVVLLPPRDAAHATVVAAHSSLQVDTAVASQSRQQGDTAAGQEDEQDFQSTAAGQQQHRSQHGAAAVASAPPAGARSVADDAAQTAGTQGMPGAARGGGEGAQGARASIMENIGKQDRGKGKCTGSLEYGSAPGRQKSGGLGTAQGKAKPQAAAAQQPSIKCFFKPKNVAGQRNGSGSTEHGT